MSSIVGTMASEPQSRPLPWVEMVMPRTVILSESASLAGAVLAKPRTRIRAIVALGISLWRLGGVGKLPMQIYAI